MKSANILIVDDDKTDIELFSAWLSKPVADYDFNVFKAHSADSGRMALEEEKIDCIIVDYRMHGGSGIEFIEQIKTSYPKLPIILTTAFPDELLELQSIEKGAQLFLKKSTLSKKYFHNKIVEIIELYKHDLLENYHSVQKMLVTLKYKESQENKALAEQ